jgi:hypothetical protein
LREHLYHLATQPATNHSFRHALEQLHSATAANDANGASGKLADTSNTNASTLHISPEQKAQRDAVFAGGVNSSLTFYYQGLDGVPNPGALPLASACCLRS